MSAHTAPEALQILICELEAGRFSPWVRAFIVGVQRRVQSGKEISEKQAGVLFQLLAQEVRK